jgi:nicotinate-nucleotide adenylyltransferase
VKIALFGGTFDPVHAGHLRAAKVAARKFRLDRILFVPSGNPPHKHQGRLTPFAHRFAMVTLACSGDPRFVPSLLEAPSADGRFYYTVDTARALRKSLGAADELYFLLGLDSFLDLPHWKDYRRLFDLMDFIVVSRPGFGSKELMAPVPDGFAATSYPPTCRNQIETIPLRLTALHILKDVEVAVASRDIRESVAAGRQVTGLVPRLVEEYIVKEGLYRQNQQVVGSETAPRKGKSPRKLRPRQPGLR